MTTKPKKTSLSPKTPDSCRSLYDRAVRLLARRDHSSTELRRKLGVDSNRSGIGGNRRNHAAGSRTNTSDTRTDTSNFSDESAEVSAITPDLIEQVLAELASAGYLNDARYAVSLAEQRREKGYGPMAIRAKLLERGVGGEHLREAMAALNDDWTEHALAALERRFSQQVLASSEQRDRARLSRFLQARGFDSSTARRAADAAKHSAEQAEH